MPVFRPLLMPLALAAALAMAAPSLVHAEGTTPAAASAKPKKVRPKAKMTLAKPTGPVPYNALSPDMQKALTPGTIQPVTPGPATAAMTPDALPQPAETNRPIPPASDIAIAPKPITVAPPPAPPTALPRQAPTVSAPAEISLRCETQVTEGKKVITTGVFFIDLFPSAVFPDQHADFKFLFVDPAHKSLIRDSICLDTLCPANVTGSAYYLVNQTTRHGSALRITLDRSKGAFYAEEIDQGMMGMFRRSDNAEHTGERGFCTPQALPNALF